MPMEVTISNAFCFSDAKDMLFLLFSRAIGADLCSNFERTDVATTPVSTTSDTHPCVQRINFDMQPTI